MVSLPLLPVISFPLLLPVMVSAPSPPIAFSIHVLCAIPTFSWPLYSADLVNAQLTGPLDLNGQSIIGTGTININGAITASNFIGNYGGASQESILNALFDNDFGGINQDPQNAVQALYQISDYDYGTILAPSDNSVDLGTII